MGRPYEQELIQLRSTYDWALKANIDSLAQAMRSPMVRPMIAIGSGGSFSAADFACYLHQAVTNVIARPYTPMEFVSSPISLRDTHLLIFSAEGTNSDILGSFRNAITREPKQCTIMSLRNESPLFKLAEKYEYVDKISFEHSGKRDGFLSTNSLLAFIMLLSRAYLLVNNYKLELPPSIESMLNTLNTKNIFAELAENKPTFWEKQTILVIYSPTLHSSAVDFESKFSEAALGNVQIADFRNFAHGRHNWLAKRATSTSIIALFSDEDIRLAKSTLSLIPKEITTLPIHIPWAGITANIAGIITMMYLVGEAGKAIGVDPGRPMIPQFGRRIYGLHGLNYMRGQKPSQALGTIAVARKTNSDIMTVKLRSDYLVWAKSYNDFMDHLQRKTFRNIVFDYDGTLCEEKNRYTGIKEEIFVFLSALLKSGIKLGIATGRGKSAKGDLCRGISSEYWDKIIISYYNGSQVSTLSDANFPNSSEEVSQELKQITNLISDHPILRPIISFKKRKPQLTIIPKMTTDVDLVYKTVSNICCLDPQLKVLKSAHSIDILPSNISKISIMNYRDSFKLNDTLTIGDRGQWPGNDYDLLSCPFSLSVDEVSSDPSTCWNLAPLGHKGVQATLDYLSCINVKNGCFTISFKQNKENR